MDPALTAVWPIFGLRVRLGDLELRPVSDVDLPELVALVLDGIHDKDRMPFSMPWTDAPPQDLPANYVRHYWEVRGRTTPEHWSIDMVVRRNGEVVGVQGISTQDFLVTRTGETGSWLGQRFQGQGIGTRMRQAMCTLAFDHLGFDEVTSAAFVDNPASLAVSRKVGYVPNGDVRMRRRPDECAVNRGLLLTPEAFKRPDAPVEVEGAAAVRVFLGIDAAPDDAAPDNATP